jgi:hypothetical protein
MFFGLTNSPATFQTMMNSIFTKDIAEKQLTVTSLGAASRAGTHVSCATGQESAIVSVYKSGITPV